MNWQEKIHSEMVANVDKGIHADKWSKWLRFKVRFLHFYWDWLTIDAVRSGWKMPRLQFKQWLFYKKYPYLKQMKNNYKNRTE